MTKAAKGSTGVLRTIVRHADLRKLAGGGDAARFKLVEPDLADDDAVLQGDYSQIRLRCGLHLHATNAYDLYNLKTESIQSAGLTFSIFLKGRVCAWLGGKRFTLGCADATDVCDATAICRTRSETFMRQSTADAHIRKVNVTASPEWLEASGLDGIPNHAAVRRFMRTHLAFFRWRPSARAVSLAEQILSPPHYAPMLEKLYLESRAIEIVIEALQAIAGNDTGDEQHILRPRDYQRALAIRDFLQANTDQSITLESLARDFGTSVNTLQRLFHAAHGKSVFEYLRAYKLERARHALERDGISIAEAAFLAGYGSASNFATAFKRYFGISPKSARAQF
jgi:AraC-like DNA-binding protein